MDLLEQPDIKETYNKCKYIVKVWEHRFKKQYNRQPSKLDIREASTQVRHAYRKYFQLKTAALEQSFMDVDGFEDEENNTKEENTTSPDILSEISQNKTEDYVSEKSASVTNISIPDKVWGPHLNNKREEIKTNLKNEETSKSDLNLSITKKLFCGSKFTKRNPRKSLSFSQKTKSDVSVDNQSPMSQPAPMTEPFTFRSEEVISSVAENSLLNDKFKIIIPMTKAVSQPVNIIQSVIQNNYQPSLKTVDTGWLDRVVKQTGNSITNPDLPLPISQLVVPIKSRQTFPVKMQYSESTKIDYDSEDIIDDSDEEETSVKEPSSYHIGKKRRIDDAETLEKSLSGERRTTPDITAEKIDASKKFTEENNPAKSNEVISSITAEKTDTDKKMAEINNSAKSNEVVSSESKSDINNLEKNAEDDKRQILKKRSKPKILRRKVDIKNPLDDNGKLKAKRRGKKTLAEESSQAQISPRRSMRTTKVKVSLEECSSEIVEEEDEEDAFHTDTDEKDPEYSLNSEKTKSKSYIFDFDDDTDVSTKVKVKQSKKTSKKIKKTEKVESEEEIEENKPYELDFSVKPRIVAPRYNNIKKVLVEKKIVTKGDKSTPPSKEGEKETEKDPYVIKGKRQLEKEKFEKKVASGNLNDNFVRIDLKKKVFVRGKSGRNFSKYKKSLWKSKKAKALAGPDMDMGGCDGGMLTCFNCGQIGHFARNCKATNGDKLLPLNSDQEEECPYPTLEEASEMARSSVLNVRIPKLQFSGDKSSSKDAETEIDVENKESESDVEEGDVYDEDFEDDFSDQLLVETLKLEEHIKKLDVRLYMDTVKTVKPYYTLNEDGSMIATPNEIYQTLKKFGHDSFRPGQEQAIMRILSGKSTLVTLSTGSGKSLCYQLPAYLYSQREPCISLIISPLVSLMDDQVVGIPKFMKAACLHSNQTKTQRQKILEAISLGDLSVLLMSPEAVVAGEKQTGFGSLLRKLPPIAFACIDEAHCVSQWSHNFRPSYLMICRVLRESLGVKTILGLTATATRATRDSIINHLQIPDGHDGVISDIPLPDNLTLTVSRDTMRDHALLGLLTSERFTDCKSVIIYCTRRDECERIAAFLRTSLKSEQVVEESTKKRKRLNLQAEPYHAGLSASRRRTIQNKFMSGELGIVVATVAFGMGINKSDIRAVIHFNMPNSFESYVQEVGRAGRDGLKAQCHVFLDSQGRDENELRRHIYANSTDRHVIRKLLQKIFIPCSCSGQCPRHEVAFSIEETVRALDVSEEIIATLLCYLELHENKYIELLSPAYTICKVISYGGPLQIRKASKECPPLAMALALHKSKTGEDPNVLEFPVVDVAAAMGWESGICKHKLKNLEWVTVNNQPKRSMLSVQFSNLGFRLFAPGNLSDDQLDEALDSLYSRVTNQEQKALMQLHAIHKTLIEVAQPSYRSCVSESGDSLIKSKVREYFNSVDPLKFVSTIENKKFSEEQLVSDIVALICMYKDNTFTGRAVARIFQGIQSPNYPAVVWGRCKFWRSHLNVDFHTIVKIATREIIRLR